MTSQPPLTDEELTLLLDYYLLYRAGLPVSLDGLSSELRRLGFATPTANLDSFRTPAGLRRAAARFGYFDGSKPAERATPSYRRIWFRFSSDPRALARAVHDVRSGKLLPTGIPADDATPSISPHGDGVEPTRLFSSSLLSAEVSAVADLLDTPHLQSAALEPSVVQVVNRLYLAAPSDLEALLDTCIDSLGAPPETATVLRSVFLRSARLVATVKELYDHKCQVCSFTFTMRRSQTPYAEAAHWAPLHLGGEDDLENLLCLCPNHHAMLDLGELIIRYDDGDDVLLSNRSPDEHLTDYPQFLVHNVHIGRLAN